MLAGLAGNWQDWLAGGWRLVCTLWALSLAWSFIQQPAARPGGEGEGEGETEHLKSFVAVSKLFLQLHSRRRAKGDAFCKRIPPENVVLILQFAGVAVTVEAENDREVVTRALDADHPYLRLRLRLPPSPDPSPASPLQLRQGRLLPLFLPTRVRVQTSTHDQGWSGEPHNRGQRNSHTWTELLLESSAAAGSPAATLPRVPVSRNLHAVGSYEEQQASWGPQSALVQALRRLMIDCANASPSPSPSASAGREHAALVLMLRSQYPGWACWCRFARVEVEYELVGFESLLRRMP